MSDQFRTALGRAEERLTAQQDRLFERLEGRFERLEAKFEQRLDASDRDTQREFGEARRDLGELRDLVAKQGTRIDDMEAHRNDNMRASAQGAAKGAGEAAGAVATAAAAIVSEQVTAAAAKVASAQRKPLLESWAGRTLAVSSAFTAIVLGLGLVPKVLVAVEAFWTFIRGLAK